MEIRDDAPTLDWFARALTDAPKLGNPNGIDGTGLIRAAASQGILPLLFSRLARRPAIWTTLPEDFRQSLTRIHYQAIASEILGQEELRRVLEHLHRAEIPVLLLKGTPLAYLLYPEPHLRSRCDTDLLFRTPSDAERAWECLASLGYRRTEQIPGLQISYQFSCHRRGSAGLSLNLDLHWRVNNRPILAQALPPEELFANSQPVPALGHQARTLRWQYALVLACVHRLGHRVEGTENRLIWLYDLHLLAQRMPPNDWDALGRLSREKGFALAVRDGLMAAQRRFGTRIPEGVLERLAREGRGESFRPERQGSALQVEWASFRDLPDWRTRGQFLREHLFPPPAYLFQKYGPHHPLWLPWLYLRRMGGGLRRFF